MNQTAHSHTHTVKVVLLVFFIVLFCVSSFMLVFHLVLARKEARAFDELLAQVEQEEEKSAQLVGAPPQDPADAPAEPESEPEPFHRYDALYKQNPDLFGWVRINGTKLNYPVMHTPDDPEHYLRRAYDGSYAIGGVPFLDADCYAGCGNYVVYGHNMKNGTMFATLSSYADEAFWEEHPVIRFDLVDEPGEYEILAAFYGKAYRSKDQGVFRYYDYTDLTGEEEFNEFTSEVEALSLYDTGVTASYGDQLLTLITCSYHTTDGRFVVVARKTDTVPE